MNLQGHEGPPPGTAARLIEDLRAAKGSSGRSTSTTKKNTAEKNVLNANSTKIMIIQQQVLVEEYIAKNALVVQNQMLTIPGV